MSKFPMELRSFAHRWKKKITQPPVTLGLGPPDCFLWLYTNVCVHTCLFSLCEDGPWYTCHSEPCSFSFFLLLFCLTLWHVYVPVSFYIGSCINFVCCWVIFHSICPVIYLINSFLDSLVRYVWSSDYILGPGLGAGQSIVNKRSLCPCRADLLLGDRKYSLA